MQYVKVNNIPSMLTLLLQGAVISTRPTVRYPLPEERWIGFEEEPPVPRPSAIAFRPIVLP